MAKELSPYDKLIREAEAAKAENIKRYEQGLGLFDDILQRYKPGGSFGKSFLAQLETQKAREVGKEKQSLISGGLFGTTIFGGAGRRFEADVGGPARLRLEDLMSERLSAAQRSKAEFIASREDTGPDLSQLMSIGQSAGEASVTPTDTSSSGGGSSQRSLQDFLNEFSGRSGGLRGGGLGGGGRPTQPGTGGTSGAGASLASRGGTSGGQGLIDPSKITGGTTGDAVDRTLQGIQDVDKSYQTAIQGPPKLNANLSPKGVKYEEWLKATGKGATFSTMMEWNRANK